MASEGSNLRNDYAPRRDVGDTCDVGDTFICHQYQSSQVSNSKRSLKRPKIRNHGCGDSGFSFSVSLTSKYLISTGYSINSDCPIINIRQNGQKLDFIGTLKASEIDRIRTMIVKEDIKTGMITIYTGGDECLTIFRQVEETEKDSIYALRLKSVSHWPSLNIGIHGPKSWAARTRRYI